jgi:hypothetical protein
VKLKSCIVITLLLISRIGNANMSSPFSGGTNRASPFSSKDINILSETIHIKIDRAFKTAKFIIEYTIQTDSAGKQIPLLFVAQDYKDNFFVWVDNQKIQVQSIPPQYTQVDGSPFSKFAASFNSYNRVNGANEVPIYWHKHMGSVYKFDELKYFETDISKGTHTVRVEYTATAMSDLSGWIKEYSFNYSLTPAKFWKSFGSLQIFLEQEGEVKQLSTNLGQPVEKNIQAKNSWVFNRLPAEYFSLTYSPKPNILAAVFIAIDPAGFALIAAILLIAWHLFLIKKYRRKFVNKKYSAVVIWGSLVIPFCILISYPVSSIMISSVIGAEAGRQSVYEFVVIVLYPLLVPVYWIIAWLFDKEQKRKFSINYR